MSRHLFTSLHFVMGIYNNDFNSKQIPEHTDLICVGRIFCNSFTGIGTSEFKLKLLLPTGLLPFCCCLYCEWCECCSCCRWIRILLLSIIIVLWILNFCCCGRTTNANKQQWRCWLLPAPVDLIINLLSKEEDHLLLSIVVLMNKWAAHT